MTQNPEPPASSRAPSRRRPTFLVRNGRSALLLAVAAGTAVVGGFLLALAPIQQPRVEVSWPQDAAQIESTALLLANQTPHELVVEFGPEAVSAAREGEGIILATVRPDRPAAVATGLIVETVDVGLRFRLGQELYTTDDAGGEWSLHSTVAGVVITRDDAVVASWPDRLPPSVDALITDVRSVSDTDELSVHVQVVDDNATSPTVLKILLLWLVVAALAAVGLVLWRGDRRRRRGPPAGPPRRDEAGTPDRGRATLVARIAVDVLVVTALVVWVFIGPMTADDGYYAVMARNAEPAGFVGMYYQIFNQTFVPFSWYWEFFDWWQRIGGHSPVWLRIPSLLAALASWAVVRVFLRRWAPVAGWLRVGLLAVTALVSVIWWCAFAIGVRPESVGALATVTVLLLVLVATERRTLLPAFLAAATASLAFASHPTGIVAFAPLLLGIVPLWRTARDGVPVGTALVRSLAIVSGGALALIAAFHSGGLRDAVDGQRRFSAVESPRTWLDELDRYNLLLEDGPQGTYAKRLVVLVGLVLVVWFVVMWAWDRRAQVRVLSAGATLMGWSFALGFVLIWITTSKWSHHFGAMSALGGLFIGFMLVVAPRLVSAQLPRRSDQWLIGGIAVASLLAPIILALDGPQSWFSWGEHVPGWGLVPGIGPISLRNYFLWGAITVVLVLLVVLLRRSRVLRATTPLAAASLLAIVSFGMVAAYMFGTFAVAAVKGLGDFSTAAANIRDPLGRDCLIENALDTWDASEGTPLSAETENQTVAAPPALLPDGTSTTTISDTGATIWSNLAEDGAGAVEAGEFVSPWYAVPALADGEAPAVAVAGHLTQDGFTLLTVEAVGPAGEPTLTPVTDIVDRHGWRTLLISSALPADAVRFRIHAESRTVTPAHWFAVSTPLTVPARTFADLFPAGTPVSMHWLMSFWFACTTPPAIADGIIEPPAGASTWADTAWDMNPWTPARGGVLAGASRLADIATLASVMDGVGSSWGRVQTFRYPMATDAYDLTVTQVVTPGWRSAFDPPSQLVEVERE